MPADDAALFGTIERQAMAKYSLNSLLFRVKTSEEFRKKFVYEFETTVSDWNLGEEEKDALRNMDTLRLNKLGANLHVLYRTSRLIKELKGEPVTYP